jgi:nicotinamide-nucleotide amidase
MKSIILTIGDELLIGQVVNTNASSIARKLNGAGIEVVRMLTVADEEEEIVKAFEEAFPAFDVVVVTGGLGPTHDDVTKKAVCRFFHTDLVSDPDARKSIENFLKERNYAWSAASEEQSLVPRGAVVIPNNHGTAPGELFERENKFFIVLPGVPHEMEFMMDDFVVPYFKSKGGGTFILHRTLKTIGISETVLAARLGPTGDFLDRARLAFLPSPSGVRMRITVVDADRRAAEERIGRIESHIRVKAGSYVYGTGEEDLEEVVGKMLRERRLKIAVAESCTGGLIGHKLTDVPGASGYLDRVVVAYSNVSKTDLLGVPPGLIEQHGAVSREVAEAMASGVRTRAGADIGISTTGIAGPDGGSPEKPVGLVWIGYSDAATTSAAEFRFGTERLIVKERAAQAALDRVRRGLLGIG